MGKLIRRNVFETNSSNTHSITFCSKDDYDKWEDGELLYSPYIDKYVKNDEKALDDYYRRMFIKRESHVDWENKAVTFNGYTEYYKDDYDWNTAIERLCTEKNLNSITSEELEEFKDYLDVYDRLLTQDEYFEDYCEGYDTYEESYTTKNGDEIVAFGYYGHD